MPQRPKTICNHPICGVKTDGKYCEEHEYLDQHTWNRHKNDPWYNLPEWKGNPNKPLGDRGGLREAHLLRNPYCKMCKQDGIYNDVTGKGQGVVDHITAFRSVPDQLQWQYFTDPDNLQTLCVHHNAIKTARQNG